MTLMVRLSFGQILSAECFRCFKTYANGVFVWIHIAEQMLEPYSLLCSHSSAHLAPPIYMKELREGCYDILAPRFVER